MEEEYQEEIEIEAIGVEVSSQPIELYKVLKLANVVDGGGQAKHYIAEGYVAVNGELEVRKRRKMYDGDFLEFNQEYYVVVCDQPPIEGVEQPKAQAQPKAEKKRKEKKAKQSQSRASSNKPAEKTNSETSVEQDKPKKSSGGRGEINFF
ncbi:RNA-binding S4 domain-containing protein [Vibrio agarivorans]|uniref:RNA-binding S4 domain-containing protein n=1 Tax=Vibrio agarivorans TaxID=153622 RepID=A0ABT7Y559_9VIBR|nr:RNA-binding S4 domain-containing protein [Vibrio agarivorans]